MRKLSFIPGTARIFSNGAYHEVPPIFSMAPPEALLVFEARLDDTSAAYAPDYAVYRVAYSDERVDDPLPEITAGLAPVGSIPVSDVEFDEERGMTIRTMGLERFADPSS